MKASKINTFNDFVKTLKQDIIRENMAREIFLEEMRVISTRINESLDAETMIQEGLTDAFKNFMKISRKGLTKTIGLAVGLNLLAAGLAPEAVANAASSAGMNPQMVSQVVDAYKEASDEKKNSGTVHTVKGDTVSYTIPVSRNNSTDRKQADILISNPTKAQIESAKKKLYHNPAFSMVFTGDDADIEGIGKYSYFIYKEGSESWNNYWTALEEAPIDEPFFTANGLVYVNAKHSKQVITPGNTEEIIDVKPTEPDPVKPEPITPKVGKTMMMDYSGIVAQGVELFNHLSRGTNRVVTSRFGDSRTFTNVADFVAAFAKANGKGLKHLTEAEISNMFSKGLKHEIPVSNLK
jgi:hypothetical protein